MTGRLILLRHGESEWNRDQRFTGWADIGLTKPGQSQMREAASLLLSAGIDLDIAFASLLKRCVHSMWIVLEAMDLCWIPQRLDWRLNERHYGGLTGLHRQEAEHRFGEAEVHHWRRSVGAVPPAVDECAARLIPMDRRYSELPISRAIRGESLLQTAIRVREAWHQALAPQLRDGRQILVVGHGNSLRALIGWLENLDHGELSALEVPNGTPIVYELADDLRMKSKTVLKAAPSTSSEIL